MGSVLDKEGWLTDLSGWMVSPLSRYNVGDGMAKALCGRMLATGRSFAACRVKGMSNYAYLVFLDKQGQVRWGRLTKEDA